MNSPFFHAKFEESREHTYFLPGELRATLEAERPTVVFGSRGSGKTTLLRAQDFRERIENPSLRHQLGDSVFRPRFIGVYAKLSRHHCESLRRFDCEDGPLRGLVFGLYLDLIVCELLADAISRLLGSGVLLDSTGRIEQQVASDFAAQWLELLQWSDSDVSGTLRSVALGCQSIRHTIEHHAQRNLPADAIAKAVRLPGFGELSRASTQLLAEACGKCVLSEDYEPGSEAENGGWHLKVCLDEAEVLSKQQQLVLNTLIRLAEWPLFPIVSYVGRPRNLTDTLVSGLTIQKADIQQIPLDRMTEPQFRTLAEGVATVRVQEFLGDSDVRFNATTALGSLDLDKLAAEVTKDSESPKTEKLNLLVDHFCREWGRPSRGTSLIDAFIAERSGLSPVGEGEFKGDRRLGSEQFRKKRVVAYLAWCRYLGRRQVPFAFAEMLLNVSDGCIRDFLSQIHQIFLECQDEFSGDGKEDVRKFLNSTVGWEIQDRAMRKASEQKRDSIPRSGVLRPVQVGRLVRGLSELTALLQNHDPAESSSAFLEAGVYSVVQGSADQRKVAANLVRDAAEAGFLKLTGDDDHPDPLDGFRTHCSLAPAFGFSYRGAYHKTVLTYSEFDGLLNSSQDQLRPLAERLAKKRAHDPQLRFPFDEHEKTIDE